MLEQDLELNIKTIKAAVALNNRAILDRIPIYHAADEMEPLQRERARETQRRKEQRRREYLNLDRSLMANRPDGLQIRERLVQEYFNYPRA